MNLTGLTSKERIINELVLDSLLPGPYLPDTGDYLDVGSGAGFPAIPLKILKPGFRAHLVEPKKKKAGFLRQIVRLTELQKIKVIEDRIPGQTAALPPQGYDVITSRGLSRFSQVMAWVAPLLKPSGLLVEFQGSGPETDHGRGNKVLHRHQLSLFAAVPYRLPGKPAWRQILILRKERDAG